MKKKIIFLLCLLLVLCKSINPFVSAQVSNHTSTASYSESYSFSGPPEESRSNSREYRVKFYQKDGTYIQRHYVYYWPSGDLYGIQSKSGTYTEPTKYLKYSIDRKI